MDELVSVIDATSTNWNRDVLEQEGLTVVDFWAPWCPWCRRLLPVFEELSEEYKGKMRFVKVNVDDEHEIAQRYGIMSLPTLGFFCNGRAVGELVGYLPKPQLKAELDKMLISCKVAYDSSSPYR